MKTTVAIYTRVSKSDGSQDPENQLRELRTFCERQGWKIVEVYTDFASGGRDDRKAFKSMMADASKRKFDQVLFWAMDRFSREGIRATLDYIHRLEQYKVGFRSYQEPFFDSAGPFKEFMISAFATFASLERARISERTLAGLANARSKGRIGGGTKVEDDPKNRAKIALLYRLRQEKKSLRQIAAETKLSVNTVQRLLKEAA